MISDITKRKSAKIRWNILILKKISLPKNKSQGERKKKKSTETQRPKKTSEKYQPVAAGSDLDPDSNKLKQIPDILKNV